ncbi:MAG: hypothetical protein U0903_05685 [Planctomycetales bacterium]
MGSRTSLWVEVRRAGDERSRRGEVPAIVQNVLAELKRRGLARRAATLSLGGEGQYHPSIGGSEGLCTCRRINRVVFTDDD